MNKDVLQPGEVTQPVDLTNCDREPIHIPGKIQSHGFLIAFSKADGIARYISDNVKALTGIEETAILNNSIKNFLNLSAINTGFLDLEKLFNTDKAFLVEDINPVQVVINEQSFDLIIEYGDEVILFDFELSEGLDRDDLERKVGGSLSRILEARSLDKTLQQAAVQVKNIIGYERVMIYKFWEDGHGEVVAEEKNEDIDSFFGLHYPASDIPKQARDLYITNLVRIIADVDSTPANILASDPNFVHVPLDLTCSTLRAVSPMHIEYLKNMGVKASFSISIVINNKLWGLIACHNYEPKLINYRARNSAKLIGKILSSAIKHREEEERKEEATTYQNSLQKIVGNIIKEWNVEEGLINQQYNILKITSASGAAVLFENSLHTLGTTPSDEEILALAEWLKTAERRNIFHTDNLPGVYPAANEFKNIASGLLSCEISREMGEFIFWFKPEFKKTVKWAGNPDKPLHTDEQGNMQLSPRRSFEVWSQDVGGYSKSWTVTEIGSVMRLREELLHILNQKSNQVRKLNEELKKAYEELDTFSFTISHDLKTPLASIKNYTEILLEDYSDLPADVKRILGRVVNSADRMNLLIKEVLAYSRIERQELTTTQIDMPVLIESIETEIKNAHKTKVNFINGDLPNLEGDTTMIYQVFSNLISNAVKYAKPDVVAEIKINGQEKENEILYTIQDNGIGIDMKHGSQIFELFKRLENVGSVEGTGVGLAIVKRILEKHQARIWYEGTPGQGTTFSITFIKNPTL